VLDSADNVEQLLDKAHPARKITRPHNRLGTSILIYDSLFCRHPHRFFLGRDDGTEDGSGGAGRDGKYGMKDAVACFM
jgi:hypothetical protein